MGDATGRVVPQATFNLVLNCALIACNGLNQFSNQFSNLFSSGWHYYCFENTLYFAIYILYGW